MSVLIKPVTEILAPGNSIEVRRRVLVCAPTYLPGYKSGGPVRSIANMISGLGTHFDFYVVTRDRDATDTQSYPGLTPNRWYRVGSARVLYCSSIRPAVLRHAFREVRPDLIVLNSFQDAFTRIAVVLRRLGAFGSTPILLAPRGEFSLGATKIKRTKKVVYRHAAKQLGLYDDLLWSLSSPHEKLDLLRAAPARRLNPDSIYVTSEITDAIASTAPHLAKESGSVKLAFISRISEMKNLHFLLELLQEIRGEVQLNLFGPVAESDVAYWGRCKTVLARLSGNAKVEYRGSLEHSAVAQVLHNHHFFVLPTRGENFCHAAVESFVHGTPVVLSDATPWTKLGESHAGFDISLNDRRGWVTALQKCADMDQETYAAYLSGAREYGQRFSVEKAVRQHLAMFEAALGLRSGWKATDAFSKNSFRQR
jgi:glycosyltransferase involved in cell wall biosynthesis